MYSLKGLRAVRSLFQGAPFTWAICGGEALDLFLGKHTREHKDVDLAVFWEDRVQVINFMLNLGWRVIEFCGNGVVHELFDAAQPSLQRNLFCFSSDNTNCHLVSIDRANNYRFTFVPTTQNDFNYVEFLFNQRDRNSFVYHWNNSITRTLDKAILEVDGVPILGPELVLLYKSTYEDATDDESDHSRDFQVTLPFLNTEQRNWLKTALEIELSKNHPWVLQLSEAKMDQ